MISVESNFSAFAPRGVSSGAGTSVRRPAGALAAACGELLPDDISRKAGATEMPPLCSVSLRPDARPGICRGGWVTALEPGSRIKEMLSYEWMGGVVFAPLENNRP